MISLIACVSGNLCYSCYLVIVLITPQQFVLNVRGGRDGS